MMVSKALVVGMYQRKLEELAALPDVQLTVLVPPYWREGDHRHHLERAFTKGYRLVVAPMAFNGHYHVHLYPTLGALLRQGRPDLVHIDEEPYNLATWHALGAAQRVGARAVFFTWQNLEGTLPLPFRLVQRDVLRRADGAIGGNSDAVAIMRRLGFARPLETIPQFGFDPVLFAPRSPEHRAEGEPPFVVGFVGRLEEAKGLLGLVRAVAAVAREGNIQLKLAGTGPLRPQIEALAAGLGIAERVTFLGQIPSMAMPALYQSFDALVLPSLTTPRWKEQFGRALAEAMLCEIPVVCSDSGELPNVAGEAGIVVPEGNDARLADALRRLAGDVELRRTLGTAGRRRALEHYTMEAVARHTWQLYRQVLGA